MGIENIIEDNTEDNTDKIDKRNIITKNKKNGYTTGCAMTTQSIQEVFLCKTCEHEGKRDCIARKQTEHINKNISKHYF